MKEKVFDRMIEYGWNFNNIEEVFYLHLNSLDSLLNALESNPNFISKNSLFSESLIEDLRFVTDFLHNLEELDETIELADCVVELDK